MSEILNNFVQFKYDDEIWYLVNDVADYLEFSRSSKERIKHSFYYEKDDIKKIYNFKNHKNILPELQKKKNFIKSNFIKYSALIKVLMNTNTIQCVSFLKDLNIEIGTYKRFMKPELSICFLLADFFNKSKIDFKTQKICGNYKIDCYLPQYKIAIEIDEYGHKYYNKKQEKEREKYILKKLNCVFVRCNPNNKDFNIFEFIGDINLKIINYLKR